MNPEKSFKAGAVRASIFLNRYETKEGVAIENYSVHLHRRFEDKEGPMEVDFDVSTARVDAGQPRLAVGDRLRR